MATESSGNDGLDQSETRIPEDNQHQKSQSTTAKYQWMPPWMPRQTRCPHLQPNNLQILKVELLDYSEYSIRVVPLLAFSEHNSGRYWSPLYEVLMVEAMWKLPVLRGAFSVQGEFCSTQEVVACYIERKTQNCVDLGTVKERFDKTLGLLSLDKEFLDICLRNNSFFHSRHEEEDFKSVATLIDVWVRDMEENGFLEVIPSFVTQAFLNINFLESEVDNRNLQDFTVNYSFMTEAERHGIVYRNPQQIPSINVPKNSLTQYYMHNKENEFENIKPHTSLGETDLLNFFRHENSLILKTQFNTTQEKYAIKSLQGENIIFRAPRTSKRALLYQFVALLNHESVKNGTTVIVCSTNKAATESYEKLKEMFEVSILNDFSDRQIIAQANETPTILYIKPSLFFGVQHKAHEMLCRNLNIKRLIFDEDCPSTNNLQQFRKYYLEYLKLRENSCRYAISVIGEFIDNTVRSQISNTMRSQFCDLRDSFNHPLAFHEVLRKPRSEKDLVLEIASICRKHTGSFGIIRCFTIKECESMATQLGSEDIRASSIHAILSKGDGIQNWLDTNFDTHQEGRQPTYVICTTSTNTFREIICPVQFIIHTKLSVSILDYYTEVNDVYRDNLLYSYTFYNPGDRYWISDKLDFNRTRGLDDMVKYCENNSVCRREYMLSYLNEEFNPKNCHKMCDICELEVGNLGIGLNVEYRRIIAAVRLYPESEIPLTKLCAHLLGDSSSVMMRSTTFGCLRELGYSGIKLRLSYLVENNILDCNRRRGTTTLKILA